LRRSTKACWLAHQAGALFFARSIVSGYINEIDNKRNRVLLLQYINFEETKLMASHFAGYTYTRQYKRVLVGDLKSSSLQTAEIENRGITC
jgi:hypothetical protein